MGRVWVDVGGRVFCTTHSTLHNSPVFEKMFPLEDELQYHGGGAGTKDDPYFLDDDPDAFAHLLNYLRNPSTWEVDPAFAWMFQKYGLPYEAEEPAPEVPKKSPKFLYHRGNTCSALFGIPLENIVMIEHHYDRIHIRYSTSPNMYRFRVDNSGTGAEGIFKKIVGILEEHYLTFTKGEYHPLIGEMEIVKPKVTY